MRPSFGNAPRAARSTSRFSRSFLNCPRAVEKILLQAKNFCFYKNIIMHQLKLNHLND